MPAVHLTCVRSTICVVTQSDFTPVPHLQVRHGLAADQGRRANMEDAITAILDFRDNLNEEVAAQAPDISSFYGVNIQATAKLAWRYFTGSTVSLSSVVLHAGF